MRQMIGENAKRPVVKRDINLFSVIRIKVMYNSIAEEIEKMAERILRFFIGSPGRREKK